MMVTYEQTASPVSRWTARLALFGGVLIIVGAAMHRIAGMSTPIALALFVIAFAAAGLAILSGLLSTALLWRYGGVGGTRTLAGIAVAAGIFAWPASFAPAYFNLPRMNDVTTDLKVPPRFVALAAARNGASGYPLERFAPLQLKAYPDLQPFLVDRSVDEAYELALDVVRRVNKMSVVAEEAPGGKLGPVGIIEAVDRTLIMGFPDDVIVRVSGDRATSRIDIRSASRYGNHDFGRNAQRTRKILKDLQQRLESSLPGNPLVGRKFRRDNKIAVPKRGQEGGKTSAGPQTGPGRGQPGAQRGPGQRVPPPSKASGQGRDKPGQQPSRSRPE